MLSNKVELPLDANVADLLLLVAKGEQEKAEQLLFAGSSVLLEKANVIDYSGRTFTNITAYQYAAWALDKCMCQMIVNCLLHDKGEAARPILRKQHDELEQTGISYILDGVMHNNQHHFDFSPLKTALQTYLDHYETWDWPERETFWCQQIGTLQRHVPAHVAQEYCNKKRSTAFNSSSFDRSLAFYNYVTGKTDTWWRDDESSEFKLGVDYAVAGGQIAGWGGGGVKRGDWRGNGVGGSAAIDLEMITRLCEVRTEDLKKIYESFLPKSELVVENPVEVKPSGLIRQVKNWIIRALS